MGILSANNNVSFNANNTCRVYIIKQIYPEQQEDFEKQYKDLLSTDDSILNKVGKWVDNVNVLDNSKVKLTKLLHIGTDPIFKYTPIWYNKNSEEAPEWDIYFLTDLLRNQMGYDGLIITDDMEMVGATIYAGTIITSLFFTIQNPC